MTNSNLIYVAISKESKNLIIGQNGQSAFSDPGALNKSLAYKLRYQARQKGVKARELYSVHEIDVAMVLPKEDAE